MRIAIFTDIYKPQVNGVVNHVELLQQHLEQWGHQVSLFVPGLPGDKRREPNLFCIPGIPLADTGYHLSIRLGRAHRALLREMDIVHVHQPFISGRFGLYCTHHFKTPLVFTNHTRYDLYVKAYLPLLPQAISETALHTYFQHFSRHCAALIAPSPSVAQVMRRWGVEGRLEVIPNGIDLSRFDPPEPDEAETNSMEPDRQAVHRQEKVVPEGRAPGFARPPGKTVAVYVGRMSPEKSVDRLLDIFARARVHSPALHLLLVGDGSETAALKRLAHRLGIAPDVTFAGEVPYAQIPAYLAQSDFFVSASTTEVHPLTFIEAAAAGLPALGIHSTGVVDIIRPDETGLIAADRDLDFLHCFLRLARDAEGRRHMSRAARLHSRVYASETNARRIAGLYADLLANGRAPLSREPTDVSTPAPAK